MVSATPGTGLTGAVFAFITVGRYIGRRQSAREKGGGIEKGP